MKNYRLDRDQIRRDITAYRYEAKRLLGAKLRLVDAGEHAVGESVVTLCDVADDLLAELAKADKLAEALRHFAYGASGRHRIQEARDLVADWEDK